MAVVLGALALSGAASAVHAETVKAKPAADFTVRGETQDLRAGPKAVKLDARRGRWGVTLNMEQPADRDMKLNDVQAGAYFRVTPSLRVGGAVAIGNEEQAVGRKNLPPERTPRVRLETAFKF